MKYLKEQNAQNMGAGQRQQNFFSVWIADVDIGICKMCLYFRKFLWIISPTNLEFLFSSKILKVFMTVKRKFFPSLSITQQKVSLHWNESLFQTHTPIMFLWIIYLNQVSLSPTGVFKALCYSTSISPTISMRNFSHLAC